MSSAITPSRPDRLAGTLSDWRRVLAAHYTRLGRGSRQRRFMAHLPDRTVKTIADHASPDIVLGIEAEDRVVGVLEIFRGADSHAEIGISVEDAYQGRGFGRALFVDGLTAAREIGITTADLYFSCENTGIRKLVTDAGGEIVRSGAECEAHVDITACASSRYGSAGDPALPPPAPVTRRLDHAAR